MDALTGQDAKVPRNTAASKGDGTMVAQSKPIESPEQMLLRLARKGRAEGCELYMESTTEEVFVTSGTMPGILYRVDRDTCTCKGHEVFGRCKHRAVYLFAIGAIVEPELDPAANAELLTARAELAHIESLSNRNMLKSTADFRNLDNARQRVDELSALIPFPIVRRITPATVSYAAD